MPSLIVDTRQRAGGGPLRISEIAKPLEMRYRSPHTRSRTKDYLYEAQISVMVTGLDDWVWTAYCFVDVYFKAQNHPEQVECLSNYGTKLDPHSCGQYPADRPIWSPREYFLRTLSSRIEQVKQEWDNAVSILTQNMQTYVS